MSTGSTSEQLVQLTYAKYSGYYSKKNWLCNLPLWDELTEDDKKWWTDFVSGIRSCFKTEEFKRAV